MSPYFETIKLLDGVINNISYHQERFERTRNQELGIKKHPSLTEIIQIPDGLDRGLYKCRVLYGEKIERIEYEPYTVREVRSLKVVKSDTISYGFKLTDRSELEALFHQRESCDDILIVKKGFVTDSYYANLALWDGEGWVTPDTPLLPGTMRASLLFKKELEVRQITLENLGNYQKIRLVNAMNDLKEGPEIEMKNVSY